MRGLPWAQGVASEDNVGPLVDRPPPGAGLFCAPFWDKNARKLYQCVETAGGVFDWVETALDSTTNQLVTDWYVAAQTGDDANAGTSAATPVKTIGEIQRRLGGVIEIPAGQQAWFPTIHLLEDDTAQEALVIRFDGSAAAGPFFLGSTTILAQGNVTAATAANPATKQDITITDAGVAANFWSAFIGKVIEFGSGAEAVIMKDLGAKTARLSQTQAGDFDGTPLVVTAGDTYTIKDCVKLSLDPTSLAEIQTLGTANFSWQHVEFGVIGDHHGVTFGATINNAESCVMHGFDGNGPYSGLFNCYVSFNLRAEALGGEALVECVGGGSEAYTTRTGNTILLFNTTCQGGSYRADPGGTLSVDISSGYQAVFDSANAVVIAVGGRFLLADLFPGTVGSLWGKGCTNGISLEGGAEVIYDASFVPSITCSGTELGIAGLPAMTCAAADAAGGMINPANGATFGRASAAAPVRTAMGEVTVDQSLVANVFTDIPGVTATLTTPAGFLVATLTVDASTLVGVADVELLFDGVVARGGRIAAATSGCIAIVYRKAVAAGAHTVKAQYKAAGGATLQIRPVTHVEESACLVIEAKLG